MSTAIGLPTAQAEPVLVHSIGLLLQQLTTGIERVKQATGTASELVRLLTTLQQLQQWLPSGHGLQMQLIKLHKLLPALLQPQSPETTVRLLAAVYALQPPSVVEPVDLTAYRSSTGLAALAPLTQLCKWQQGEDERDATALVQPLLLSLLQQLVTLARKSVVDAAEIGTLLLRMQVLFEFTGNADEQSVFSELAQATSLAILQPDLPSRGEQLATWQALWRLVQQRQLSVKATAVCHDLELLQTVQIELDHYRRQLQGFLQQAVVKAVSEPVLPSYHVLLLHYRLPWIFAAVEQHGLAQLCHAWYQCLVVHWQHRLPLASGLLALWPCLMVAMDLAQWPTLLSGRISRWHWQLLQQWPIMPTRPVERVAFHGVQEGEDKTVPLAGIPDLLSRAFVVLTEHATAQWFVDVTAYEKHATALTGELRLLEQAAAAIKLPAIESFCSLLLSLHHWVQRSLAQHPLPADLLWRSHLHLRDLLDAAAAWQEPAADIQLMTEIKLWLEAAPLQRQLAYAAADAADAMLLRLQNFVEALAHNVEQPLRFSVELVQALPPSQLPACEEALIALLRFVVLEQVQDMPQRRQALKPKATTLLLRLESTEEAIAVEITEAGVEKAPDSQTLKRLRHKLPIQVQRLYCHTQPGRGRCFRFVI